MHKESYLKSILLIIFLLALFLVGFFESKLSKKEKLFSETKFYLGSIVELKFYCNNENRAKKVINDVFTELRRIEEKYSLYIESSYLSKLNSVQTNPKPIDEETFYLLTISDSAYKITRKKFDPSIGKITEYWNKLIEFQNTATSSIEKDKLIQKTDNKSKDLIFDDEFLKDLKLNSGWENVTFTSDRKISFNDLWLTLDGIVQGYAADIAISVLKSNGIKKALVNVGGEIKVIGEDWKIGIKHPRIPEQLIEKLNVSNVSIATSGDYEKFFEFNGKRYHHLIDPETSYPSNKNMSVTVISENCALADALSTGFFSLEADTILNIVNSLPDIYVYIVDAKGRVLYSKNFEKYLWR